jgi:hypothetical protein
VRPDCPTCLTLLSSFVAKPQCLRRLTVSRKLRIVREFGWEIISRKLTRLFRDARRFPSPGSPVPRATRTPRKFGICPIVQGPVSVAPHSPIRNFFIAFTSRCSPRHCSRAKLRCTRQHSCAKLSRQALNAHMYPAQALEVLKATRLAREPL